MTKPLSIEKLAAASGAAMERAYWVGKFSGAPEPMAFPADAVPGQGCTCLEGRWEGNWVDRLVEVSNGSERRQQVLLLSALVSLLHRYTGQTDILIGTPIDRQEHDKNAFVNTVLPLSVPTGKGQTFRALLQEVHRELKEAVDHQNYPYESLVNHFRKAYGKKEGGLFSVAFSLDNVQDPSYLDDWKDSTLLFSFCLNEGRLDWKIIPGRANYRHDTLELLMDQYKAFLQKALYHPDEPHAAMSLEEAEPGGLPGHCAGPEMPLPQEATLTALFGIQVKRTPEAQALLWPGGAWTYRELHEKANQLAHMLLDQAGVTSEAVVAVHLGRGPEMIAAILGVLKAGAAFMPLDTTHPADRVEKLVTTAGARAIVCKDGIGFDPAGICVIDLRADAAAISAKPVTSPEIKILPEQLAYIIFTSGSTGTPKGVMVEHRSIVNMSTCQVQKFGVTTADTVLQFAALTFDAAVSELFMAFFAGAALALPTDELISDKDDLLRWMRDQQVTVTTFPPSFLRLMQPRDLSFLRCLITAGEAADPALMVAFAEQVEVYNAYGPTECSVCVSIHRVSKEDKHDQRLSIGKPIANLHVEIFDEEGKPLPRGLTGELVVSGIGLARGYVGEGRTRGFREHPARSGVQVYFTGDLCRWRADDRLEIIGRKDRQIKLRGYRIEPGEIEHSLGRIPGISQAVVQLAGRKGDQRLVAWYTGEAMQAAILKQELAKMLPGYMIPALYQHIEQMPLTRHGKVDLLSLPNPEESYDLRQDYIPAETPLEQNLVAIWQEILDRPHIGVMDNFFEIGGQSLKATQLVSRIQRDLGYKLGMRSLLLNPTIRGVAGILSNHLAEKKYETIPRVQDQEDYPLSFAQQRLWVENQLLTDPAAYNLSGAYAIRGAVNTDAVFDALEQVIDAHGMLRTTFRTDAVGHPRQVVHREGVFRPERREWDLSASNDPEKQLEKLIRQLRSEPFDLASGPLFRLRLYKLGPEKRVLVMILHHIVADGWSLGFLIRDFLAAYQAAREGKTATLTHEAVRYVDYAQWQTRFLSGAEGQIQEKYWQRQLDAPVVMNHWPFEKRAQDERGGSGLVKFRIEGEQARALKAFAMRHEVSLFMVFLTGIFGTIHRHTGKNDLLVGFPIAGRKRSELETLVGFLVNLLPLRLRLGPDERISDLLAKVRDTCLEAFDHQDFPYDRMIGLARGEGVQSPLIQTGLTWLNLEVQRPGEAVQDAGELLITPFATPHASANFPFWFFGQETPETLHLAILFQTGRFDSAQMERIGSDLTAFLAAMTEDVKLPVANFPLSSMQSEEQTIANIPDVELNL